MSTLVKRIKPRGTPQFTTTPVSPEARAFNELPDDAMTRVFHGTSAEHAASLRKSRTVTALEDHWSNGLYVAPTHDIAQGYGDVVMSFNVRKGDLRNPPEEPTNLGKAWTNPAVGAVLPVGHKIGGVVKIKGL